MIVFHKSSTGYFDAIKGQDNRFPETVISVAANVADAVEMPNPDDNFVKIVKTNGTDPEITQKGTYYPYGDVFVDSETVLFLPSETAKSLRIFYKNGYTGGNNLLRYIFPTALLCDPISKSVGAPAKAFSLCPGGYLTLTEDEMLYGYDAGHYIFKKDEMIAVADVHNASIPYFPYPEDIKSAAFINRINAGKIGGGNVSLLATYTSPENGVVLFDQGARAVVESFRMCFKKGIPFENLDRVKSRKLVTKNGLSNIESSVLFGSNKYSIKAQYSVYVGSSAELRLAAAVERGDKNFEDADLFDINDEISRIMEDANVEGRKAFAAYYDSIVTSVVEYVGRVKSFAEEYGNNLVAAEIGRGISIGASSIAINEPLLEVTTAAVPPKGGTNEQYVNQLIALFGRGMNAEEMNWDESLENSVKDQVSRRLTAINTTIDEAIGLVNQAMGAFKYVDTSTYSKGFWCFGDRDVTLPSVTGSEVKREVKNVVMTKNGNKLHFTLQFAFVPYLGVNYKIGEDALVGRVKAGMSAAFATLGLDVRFVGLGAYCADRGEAAWWLHDKQTSYRCFMGVHEYRDRYKGIDRNYDVCREQLWEFSFDVNLPSTTLELDLSATNDSAYQYFLGKATTAHWMAFARHVVTHLENAVELLKERRPFVRVDGIIYSLSAAAAFGVPIVNVDALGNAIVTLTAEKKPENLDVLLPAIELLEFVRDTIMSCVEGVVPMVYITESDLENSVEIADPDCLPLQAFSMVTEV